MPPQLPLHRHQSSLEGVIDFSTEPPLGTDQRTQAKCRFYHIVDHFEAANSRSSSQYNRPRLVRFTYEYALSEESRDNFLRSFFQAVALSIDGEEDIDFEELRSTFFGFADHLLDNFFLPLKASTKKTPQPSPAYHSAVQRVQGGGVQDFAGTPDRVSALRGACLIRDRHRCVISRKFDYNEAVKRLSSGTDARDDDGSLLLEDEKPFESLEVAHILPHSLTKVDAGSQLDPYKQAALAILNMFDSGVAHLIKGTNIDQPRNAITLTHTLHQGFGDFKIFFEATDQSHTYRINSFLPRGVIRDPAFPVVRTLYLTDTRTIDPPLPRLLAIHRAIAHILHLSAAGDYIDKLLRDMAEKGIQADGSTELDRLVKLGLGGWLDGTVYT